MRMLFLLFAVGCAAEDAALSTADEKCAGCEARGAASVADSGADTGEADAECLPEDCGPEPGLPNYECEDGTMAGPTGRCLVVTDSTTPSLTCAWEIIECE